MATIQIKRGTAADWLAANTVLALGELVLETATNKLKAGNGTSSWYELQYIAGSGGGGGGAVTSVNSKTGDVVLVKADLGLGEVDNTSDAAKPISLPHRQHWMIRQTIQTSQLWTPRLTPKQHRQIWMPWQ